MPVQDGDRRVFYLQCFCLVMLEKFAILGDAKQVKDKSMVPILSGDTVHTENMTDIVSFGLLIYQQQIMLSLMKCAYGSTQEFNMAWVVPRVLGQTQGAASISAIDAFQDPTVYGVTSQTRTLLGTPIELLHPGVLPTHQRPTSELRIVIS